MKKGFTLIELLVVISIIGLLSSVVLASLREARNKAEITKVRQSFKALEQALDLYKSDNDGAYPNSTGITLDDLRANYLDSYLKTTPTLPALFQQDGPIYYLTNDYLETYFTCGINPVNDYVVYYQGVSPDDELFPERLEGGSVSTNTYCAFIPHY